MQIGELQQLAPCPERCWRVMTWTDVAPAVFYLKISFNQDHRKYVLFESSKDVKCVNGIHLVLCLIEAGNVSSYVYSLVIIQLSIFTYIGKV